MKVGRTGFLANPASQEIGLRQEPTADDPKPDKQNTDMFVTRPDKKKKITFTDLLIRGMLGAAWLPLGIAAAAGIGGRKYCQSQSEKPVEGYKPNDPEAVTKLEV